MRTRMFFAVAPSNSTRETVRLAVRVDHAKIASIAPRETPSCSVQGVGKFFARRRLVPKRRDGRLGFLRAESGALALLHLGMARRPLRSGLALSFGVRSLHGREAEGAFKIAGSLLVFVKIEAVGNRPPPRQVNPRPDDMPMPAPVLHMRDHGAGLAGEAKRGLKSINRNRPLVIA